MHLDDLAIADATVAAGCADDASLAITARVVENRPSSWPAGVHRADAPNHAGSSRAGSMRNDPREPNRTDFPQAAASPSSNTPDQSLDATGSSSDIAAF